ncbi:MAG: hypothetical protein HDS50_01065 [Bacteroides sp.]|nr:hypothetical protein [Bacteroides sp.]
MGRNSGGVNNYAKGGNTPIAVTSSGKKMTASQTKAMLASSSSIGDMKNRDMQKQINRAISRYEKVMGVRERSIKLADVPGAYGITFISKEGSHGIFLSRSSFDRPKKDFETKYKNQNYVNGFKNITNRAAQHTVTHELAHATWTSSYDSPTHKAAGKEINKLFDKWKADKKKKGYGNYGKSNVDEFWAEVVTKGIHGTSDKYTKRAISIAKRYKL